MFPFRLPLRQELRCIRSLMAGLSASGKLILDVGCGTGTSLAALPSSARLVLVDSSAKMLRQLQKNGNVHLVRASATALPFKPDTFYLVTAIGLSEYLSELNPFFREVGRVTVCTGYMLVTCAPRHLINFLRFLLGQRLYLQSPENCRKAFQLQGWTCLRQTKSLFQCQFISQKKKKGNASIPS